MLRTIKQITEEEFQLENIEKRNREYPYPEARAVYYDVSKETIPEFSFDRIAKFMGNRDHSTAMHGIRKLKDTYLRERKIREIHEKVMERIYLEVSELELLRKENIELKRKLEECCKC